MHMKDLVKLQLSMRKLAQVYNYIEPRVDRLDGDLEEGNSLESLDQDNKTQTGKQLQEKPQFVYNPTIHNRALALVPAANESQTELVKASTQVKEGIRVPRGSQAKLKVDKKEPNDPA